MEDYIGAIIAETDMSQYLPLNEIVYFGLRRAIIEGKVPVGIRINEKEYASRMNISRTPIRESLKRLEIEELVEYIPRYGVIVKKMSSQDVVEIYQIRVALDVLATTNAMNLMTDEQFDEMEALLVETDKMNAANRVEDVIPLFTKFNHMIYKNAKMPRLISISNNLQEYLKRFRDMSLKEENRCNTALAEHWKIFKAMKSPEKDIQKITAIIENHLKDSQAFIISETEKENAKNNL